MIAVLLVAVAAGVAGGLARLKVWALIPATAIYSMITIIEGMVAGLGAGKITITFLIGAAFLQLFYLIGWLLSQEQKRRVPAPRSLRPELVRAMQSAIGQELRSPLPFVAGFTLRTGLPCSPIEGAIRIEISRDVIPSHDKPACKVRTDLVHRVTT